MQRILQIILVTALLVPAFSLTMFVGDARAYPPGGEAFAFTWSRTDLPVYDGDVTRTWMWGNGAYTQPFMEPYLDSPDGARLVQYYDKSRMEITDPTRDWMNDPWFVTNGLLARELITGEMQTGDHTREPREPAQVQVAGDNHPDSPTYADLNPLLGRESQPTGTTLVERLTTDGQIEIDSALASHGVTVAEYVPDTEQAVAGPFWEFMNSSGLVRSGTGTEHAPLFENPFYATGFPITGAYWVHVPVAGEFRDVLVQCFERRCLTYTPGNPQGWEVEAGNIGQHYYRWRYVDGVVPDPSFSAGSGAEDDPYHVESIEHLQAISYYPNAHFVQIANIDASDTSSWNDGQGFEPIAQSDHHPLPGMTFSGSYRGNAYQITNLTVNRPDEFGVGLFSTNSGIIDGVQLHDVNIEGHSQVGGLIGLNQGTVRDSVVIGTISGEYVVGGIVGVNRGDTSTFGWSDSGGIVQSSDSSGQIIGGSYAGGIAGENFGVIETSSSTADVTGETDLGGLVGKNWPFVSHHGSETSAGVIRFSGASGSVSGVLTLGGLVGYSGGVIDYSYGMGNVSASERIAGGLVGANDGSIHRSYATGDVTGEDRLIGGLVGWNQSSGDIHIAYATGNVHGYQAVGGLIGENWAGEPGGGTVSQTYSAGSVSGAELVGGLIGDYRSGQVNASYWDIQSTGQPNATGSGNYPGMHGLTTPEMTSSNAPLNMNELDFENAWFISPGGVYPQIQFPPAPHLDVGTGQP